MTKFYFTANQVVVTQDNIDPFSNNGSHCFIVRRSPLGSIEERQFRIIDDANDDEIFISGMALSALFGNLMKGWVNRDNVV